MNVHAGKSQDERVAAREQQKQQKQQKQHKQQPSLEQPGGEMAVEGTQADATHSSGQLSEAGKRAWQTGTGMDGGGKRR